MTERAQAKWKQLGVWAVCAAMCLQLALIVPPRERVDVQGRVQVDLQGRVQASPLP